MTDLEWNTPEDGIIWDDPTDDECTDGGGEGHRIMLQETGQCPWCGAETPD